MKRTILKVMTILLCLGLNGSRAINFAQTGSADEVLTNEKVITMTQAGLPASIVVNKIRSSKTNFDTSTDELIRLKNAKVPDDIINAMVEALSNASISTSRTGAGDVSKTDPNDPLATHEAGIYLFEEKTDRRKWCSLNPRFPSKRKVVASSLQPLLTASPRSRSRLRSQVQAPHYS